MRHGTLRILTLNCWNVSPPFEERMALIRESIAALDPDLVGLEEIIVRRDGFDQASILLDGLGYERAFGAAYRFDESGSLLPHDHAGDGFGNVVASRWPIARVDVQELPGAATSERRTAIAVHVAAPFGTLPFVVTHLNWKLHHGHVRERQVLALAKLARDWGREAAFPPIVVGDMNAEPESSEIRFLSGLATLEGRSTYFQDAWRVAGDGGPGYTWDNRNPYAAINREPSRRIDYVLVGPARLDGRGWIESASLALNEPRGDVWPSDHFGVVVDVRI